MSICSLLPQLYLEQQECMRDHMAQWQQLMQKVLGDVIGQIAKHQEFPTAALPEARCIVCVALQLSISG